MRRTTTMLGCLAALAPLGAAQARVWVVDDDGGPGVDFTTIQAAVDAAVDGELVLVRTGEYAGFSVDDKALVVSADSGAAVQVEGCVSIRDLAPFRSLTLRGLGLEDPSGLPFFAVIAEDNAGPIWIEDCWLRGHPDVFTCPGVTTTCLLVSSASVTFVRGEIGTVVFQLTGLLGPSIGLWSEASDVQLHDVGVHGGKPVIGHLFTWSGGAGMVLVDGTVFGSGSRITGGDGGPNEPVLQCELGGSGGIGAFLGEDGRLIWLDGVIEGGEGSTTPGVCGGVSAPDGPATVLDGGELVSLAGTARHLVANSPVREGETWRVDLESEPGDLAVLAMATQHLPLGYYAPWKGALLNVLRISIAVLGVVPPEGVLTLSGTVEDVYDPGEGLPLFFQGAVITPAGEIVLTPGSVQVQLDGGV